jgi:hypothetical protein
MLLYHQLCSMVIVEEYVQNGEFVIVHVLLMFVTVLLFVRHVY